MKHQLLRAIIPVASLSLIGYGAWLAWPPAGPLSVGLLLWLDLSLGSRMARIRNP